MAALKKQDCSQLLSETINIKRWLTKTPFLKRVLEFGCNIEKTRLLASSRHGSRKHY
jgi:hypothetical protein